MLLLRKSGKWLLPRGAARSFRKAVLFLHLWSGLSIGLYFSLMGLTGSVLVFERDLHPLTAPELRRVTPPVPNAPLMPLSEVVAALKRQLPAESGKHLGRIEVPESPGGAFALTVGDTEQPSTLREVTLDPYTGRILRNRRAVTSPLSFLALLHTTLLWGKAGARLQSWLGLLTALLLLSGAWLWWPGAFAKLRLRLTVKRGVGGGRLARDLHNVIGIFALPLLLLSALTGATLGNAAPVQAWLYRITGAKDGAKKLTVRPPSDGRRLAPELLLQSAETAAPPDALTKSFTLPTKPEQPFVVIKSRGEEGFLQRVTVTLDPYTGKTLRVEDEQTAPVARRMLRTWTRLHFGWWGQWPTKILYSLSGLMPMSLFLTGVFQYVYRRRGRAILRTRRQQNSQQSPPREERGTVEHD